MSARRGPAVGDRFQVLHTCSDHLGGCVATFAAEDVTRLSDGHTYRVRSTRCDGSPIEFTVDAVGRDSECDVLHFEPQGALQ